jgi:hypothetical protein
MSPSKADPNYIWPDRSNRPTNESDPFGETKEMGSGYSTLADGRPCVVEIAVVSGFTVYYYYFDADGLEHASTDELSDLMRRSGVTLTHGEAPESVASEPLADAQGRPIIEFAVYFRPNS